MENNLPPIGRNNILLYTSEQNPDSSNIENGVRGQLGNGLTKTIASARDASLFDPPEIASREKELRELLDLRHDEAKVTQHHMRQAMGNIDFHISQLEEKIIRITKQAKYDSQD